VAVTIGTDPAGKPLVRFRSTVRAILDARPLHLPMEANVCRHGKELRRLTTYESVGSWLIWGHYACPECPIEVLHHSDLQLSQVTVGGRTMEVHPRDVAPPIQVASEPSREHDTLDI